MSGRIAVEVTRDKKGKRLFRVLKRGVVIGVAWKDEKSEWTKGPRWACESCAPGGLSWGGIRNLKEAITCLVDYWAAWLEDEAVLRRRESAH